MPIVNIMKMQVAPLLRNKGHKYKCHSCNSFPQARDFRLNIEQTGRWYFGDTVYEGIREHVFRERDSRKNLGMKKFILPFADK
ncbi:hypothetical protein KY285_024042 [Solanum tuberosum]|nr:hypothetical protein KY285_024042 [Solanum tuberosum]